MEVKIVVTLQVDDDENSFAEKELKKTATEAVKNALRFADDNGFEHTLSNEICIGFVDANPMDIKIIANVKDGVVQGIYCSECDVDAKVNDRDCIEAETESDLDRTLNDMDREEEELNQVC